VSGNAKKSVFDELLDKQIYSFISLKRLYELQVTVLHKCEGRPIKNDLIYQQMLFSSFDGLFARLYNYHDGLLMFLNILKSNHLDNFKRNNKRGLEVNAREVLTDNFDKAGVDKRTANIFTKGLQSRFDETYDRLFPGVRERKEGRPNHSDFDLISNELRNVFLPIKAHRDTVVAHWDEKMQPATVHDLKKAAEFIEYLLGALQSISRHAVPNFELGGIAAHIGRTATDLAEVILGDYRVRAANPNDMDDIFKMGFGVWGDGQSESDYLIGCHESPKYAKGTWYVLEDREEKAVSSLIVYPLLPLDTDSTIGIGSIATHPLLRKRGHARKLIWDILRLFLDRDKIQVAYLWSDIGAEFYRHLGFTKLPDKFQIRENSFLMIKCSNEQMKKIASDSTFKPPVYF
jgi:N-acetylglutamate synthase-like GNAT family acetyltransferase